MSSFLGEQLHRKMLLSGVVGAFEKSSSFPSLALRSFFTVCFCFSALPHAPISVSEVLSSVVKKVSLPYLVAYSVCIPRTHETP